MVLHSSLCTLFPRPLATAQTWQLTASNQNTTKTTAAQQQTKQQNQPPSRESVCECVIHQQEPTTAGWEVHNKQGSTDTRTHLAPPSKADCNNDGMTCNSPTQTNKKTNKTKRTKQQERKKKTQQNPQSTTTQESSDIIHFPISDIFWFSGFCFARKKQHTKRLSGCAVCRGEVWMWPLLLWVGVPVAVGITGTHSLLLALSKDEHGTIPFSSTSVVLLQEVAKLLFALLLACTGRPIACSRRDWVYLVGFSCPPCLVPDVLSFHLVSLRGLTRCGVLFLVTCVYMCMCVRVCMHVHVCVCVCAYTCACVCVCACTCALLDVCVFCFAFERFPPSVMH